MLNITTANTGLTQNGDPLGYKPKAPTRRRAKMKKAPLPPCLPSQQTNGTIQSCEQMATPHPGDDCAINELLEGTMDLEVVLPDARRVRMTIERRMPMMDLLVQATTANKISPGGHVITLSPEGDRDNLHYKPSTPIGSLDTNTVYIMSKSAINDPPAKKMSRTQLQPFEPTFRLQVNLPRNQLMVMRVSPKTTLAEIKKMVCTEKGFEPTRYHLVHPTQPNYLIDLNCKLSEYGGAEISLMSDLSVSASICNSTSDLIGYSGGDDDKKRKKLLGIFKRKSKSVNNMMIAGEAFKDPSSSRGVSPARSDICDTHSLRAKRQSTKKRAPPPPPVERSLSNGNSSTSEVPVVVTSTATTTTATTTMVSHSRQSSDSSGYHEASVLSDCPDNLSPETSSGCASSGVGVGDSPIQRDISVKRNSRTPTREKPNFSSVAHSMLIISTSKKRRAPPPPPLSPNKDTERAENGMDSTLRKDHHSTSINGEATRSPNSRTNSLNTNANISYQPASPDSLPRSPASSESNASCSSPVMSVSNDISSPESSPLYSPVHSPCLPTDTTIEVETSNDSVAVRKHTEEETGEVIHLLEKDTTDQKSKHKTDLSVSTLSDTDTSEQPKINLQHSAEIKADQTCNEEISEKEEISTEVLPLDTFCTEDEYAALNEVEWDFNIPEPPSPFRNSVDNFHPLVGSENEVLSEEIEKEANSNDSISFEPVTGELLNEELDPDNSSDEILLDSREKSLSILSTESCAPPLPSSYPPRENIYRTGSESSDIAPPLPLSEPPLPSCNEPSLLNKSTKISHSLSYNNDKVSSASVTNNSSENPNSETKEFIGSETENQKVNHITSYIEDGHETGECVVNQMFIVAPQPRRRAHLQNFTIGSYKNETNAEIIPWNSQDNLSDKYTPVTNNINKDKTTAQKPQDDDTSKSNISKYDYTVIPFKSRNMSKENGLWETNSNSDVPARSSSSMPKAVTDQIKQKNPSLCNLQKDDSTRTEEQRLQEEYQKLQNQLVAWQQQLLKNQTLLQQKQIVPEMNVPTIASISTKSDYTEKQMPVYRSQTLPRPKPTIHKEIDSDETTRSSTVEYHSSNIKPQVLTNVTIGSWKSKSTDVFNSSSVSDMKPKFQTLAPIISLPQTNGATVINKRRNNNILLNSETKSGKPYISATFDIKPKFQRHAEENSDTLVTEKTDGNPALILAQIRNEIRANSRHPTGISVSTTDTNSTLPENNSAKQSTKVSIKSKPHITYSYFGNTSSNSRSPSKTMVSHTNKNFENTKDSSGTKPVVIATIKSKNSVGMTNIGNKDSNTSMLHFAPEVPPSPPPPPTLPPAPVPTTKGNNKLSNSQIKISRTESSSDPREELMIEIRKFGGRPALRKVPLNQAGWHLKVFGTLSSTPV